MRKNMPTITKSAVELLRRLKSGLDLGRSSAMPEQPLVPCVARIVVFAAVTLMQSGVCTADGIPDNIARLEAVGNFAEARSLLAKETDKTLVDHRLMIEETERVEAIARRYIDRKLPTRAQQVLQSMLGKLDGTRDVYLVLKLQDLIDTVSPRPEDVAAAQATLKRADTLFERRAYKRAKELYESVAKESADLIGREQVSMARDGFAKAAQAEINAEPFGLLQESLYPLLPAASTLATWSIVGSLTLVALIALGRARRRWLVKPGVVIELVDLTAPSDNRPTANSELNERLVAAIERIVRAGQGVATLEAAPGPESSAIDDALMPADLTFVAPALQAPELAKFSEIVQAAPAVQLGPVGFNPQQLWAMVRWLFTPTFRYSMTGTLYLHDGDLVLHVTHVDRARNAVIGHWSATSPSTAGRAACLVNVAAQIVLANASVATTVTSSPESLRHYVAGLEALAAGEKAGALDTARVEFQAALNLDPQNWLARFQLAVVLRKIGDSSAAIMHFEWFKKALASQTVPSLTHYLQSCPDFPYVVQYHLASAYAQSDGRNDLYTAEKMFGELMALPGTPAGTLLEAAHKLRHLEMLGRSGDTALQIALVYRNHNGGEANQKVQREVGSRIQEYVQWFDDRADELEHAWAADYMLARGLLLYAHGRMQYLRGDRRGAIKSLTEATALVPRFADVYVDLANTYLAIKSPHDWPQRVMVLLDRALAIDTSNPKARFAYARFYFTNVGRNLRKAEEYLRDLPPHPGSLFMYAQVMAAEDKYAEAIELLDRSIAMNKEGSSYRIRMYGECLWELAQGGASLKRLRQARRSFLEHMKLVKDADEVDRLTRLLNEINELIARLQGTPAALASPPSPEAPQGGPTPDEPVRHAQRRA